MIIVLFPIERIESSLFAVLSHSIIKDAHNNIALKYVWRKALMVPYMFKNVL